MRRGPGSRAPSWTRVLLGSAAMCYAATAFTFITLTREEAALTDAHNGIGAAHSNAASPPTVSPTPDPPFDVGLDTEHGLIRIRLFGSPDNNDARRFFKDALAYYAHAGTPLFGAPFDFACDCTLAIPFR